MQSTSKFKLLMGRAKMRCMGSYAVAFLGSLLMSSIFAAAAGDNELFQQWEIITPAGMPQTLVPGNFRDSDNKEIAILNRIPDGSDYLRLFELGSTGWTNVVARELPAGILFVDKANIAGRDRLITYINGHLNWYDPDTGSSQEILALSIDIKPTRSPVVPRADIVRDINDDGLDDFVVPDLDGFWIVVQLANGSFSDPLKLGPPEPFEDTLSFDDSRRQRDTITSELTRPWYLSRQHRFDYDQDGRGDLVFWNEDHFDVYLQQNNGLFSDQPLEFTTNVPFDFDGAYALSFSLEADNMFGIFTGIRRSALRTALESFRDIDGDGIPDLVTVSVEGRSGFRQRGIFDVYFGSVRDNRVVFTQESRSSIEPSGKRALGYTFMNSADFDGDGQVDVLVQKVSTNVMRMVLAMAANSVTIDLDFFRNEDGNFPKQPTVHKRVRSEMRWFGSRGPFFPAVFVADVNGDGRSDYLVCNNWTELTVYLAEDSEQLFAAEPQRVTVDLPSNEVNTFLDDLNGDGKQDILINHVSTEHPQRLITLIAN